MCVRVVSVDTEMIRKWATYADIHTPLSTGGVPSPEHLRRVLAVKNEWRRTVRPGPAQPFYYFRQPGRVISHPDRYYRY